MDVTKELQNSGLKCDSAEAKITGFWPFLQAKLHVVNAEVYDKDESFYDIFAKIHERFGDDIIIDSDGYEVKDVDGHNVQHLDNIYVEGPVEEVKNLQFSWAL